VHEASPPSPCINCKREDVTKHYWHLSQGRNQPLFYTFVKNPAESHELGEAGIVIITRVIFNIGICRTELIHDLSLPIIVGFFCHVSSGHCFVWCPSINVFKWPLCYIQAFHNGIFISFDLSLSTRHKRHIFN
jgi:hypothetical protein